jgi:predicted nucleic acid-binding Zn ribbon protein
MARCGVFADETPDVPAVDPAPAPADQARSLLDRARRATPAKQRRPRRTPAEEQAWSGSGADPRDPATLGAVVDDLVRDRQWDKTLRSAGILTRWERIVGADVASHCRPVRLEAGRLTCVAESTAWATQIRLLTHSLLERIADELGTGVVTALHVQGPTAPHWRHGPLRVTGRGPRDTYG